MLFRSQRETPASLALFLEAYHRAHPRRLLLLKERERGRRLTLMLPDLGSEQKNHKLDSLLSEFAEKVARLIEDT